jgi:hypothetical protein
VWLKRDDAAAWGYSKVSKIVALTGKGFETQGYIEGLATSNVD